jgi:hypothetical protein
MGRWKAADYKEMRARDLAKNGTTLFPEAHFSRVGSGALVADRRKPSTANNKVCYMDCVATRSVPVDILAHGPGKPISVGGNARVSNLEIVSTCGPGQKRKEDGESKWIIPLKA